MIRLLATSLRNSYTFYVLFFNNYIKNQLISSLMYNDLGVFCFSHSDT